MEDNKEKTTPINDHTANSSKPEYWRYYHRRMVIVPILVIIALFVFGALLLGGFSMRRDTVLSRRAFMTQGFERGGQTRFGGAMLMNHGGFGAHVTLGAVTKIDGNIITIKQNDQDVVVTVASDTAIYKNDVVAKQSDIAVGSVIIVRGAPGSNGDIAAKSIAIN